MHSRRQLPSQWFQSFFFASLGSTSSATVNENYRPATPHHGAVQLKLKLTSYSETQKDAKIATFVKAVEAQQLSDYLQTVANQNVASYLGVQAYLDSVAQAKQQRRHGGGGSGGGTAAAAQARAAHAAAPRRRATG